MPDQSPILITGGTGFIGSYLALDLLKDGHHVVLFDRNPDLRRVTQHKDFAANPAWKERLTFVQGDLTVEQHVYAAFDAHRPRTVYHLGALLSAGAQANPTMGFDVDLLGTRHVLEVARLLRQTRRHEPIKVLFPSTIASFGEHLSPPFDHNNVANEATQMPTTIYGVAKVAVERLGEYYYRQRRGTLDGLPWVDFRAVRFPSVLGASRGPGGTTAYSTLMIEEPVLGNNYEAYVAEDVRLAILYVKDAVQALRKLEAAPDDQLGSSDAPPGSTPQDRPIRRVFNIRGIIDPVTNQPPTARQIADAVARLGGQAAQANPQNFPRGIGKITFKSDPGLQRTVTSFGILDESRAQQEIGYAGQFTKLDDAVKDFIQQVIDSPGRITRLDLIG